MAWRHGCTFRSGPPTVPMRITNRFLGWRTGFTPVSHNSQRRIKMRKKHRSKLLKVAMAYLFLWSCGANMNAWAAVSGHYTDMLPNPTSAPGVTSGTIYYNGYDWQMATLPATTTPGDAESRSIF